MKNHPETKFKTISHYSEKELQIDKRFLELLKKCPIPKREFLANLSLFLKRQNFSKILFLNELYKKILGVHGVIMEFGVRWGRNLALFESLRGAYEPYNHNRKIIGFDTFAGFPSVHRKDGRGQIIKKESYLVAKNYEKFLSDLLDCHEQNSPISHIKKYELVKGDVSFKLKEYLKQNPETIIALAYFDLDIYEPTKNCLKLIKNHLTAGSLIGFDQLNTHHFPGETLALKEVFGLSKYSIRHISYGTSQSYIMIKNS